MTAKDEKSNKKLKIINNPKILIKKLKIIIKKY